MDIFHLAPNMKLSIAVSFFAVSAVLVFLAIANALTDQKRLTERLTPEGRPDGAKKSTLMAKFASQITLPDNEEISRIRYLLSQAGFFSPSAVSYFYAIRVLTIILPQLILIAAWSLKSSDLPMSWLVFASAILALIGLFGPQMVVKKLKARRTLICKEGFPDMMDLLVACIEAGLGLDAALIRVANELARRYPPLKTGLDLMNLELLAGRQRHEALKNFADREKALALSAKLTVPLIVFIFPTIMVMLLLPAGIRLAQGL